MPTEEAYGNFKAKFNARLHSEDKLMSKHEHLWKPIVKNILIAIFTLGTVLGIQLIRSKITTGRALFFGAETDKHKIRNQVEQTASKLSSSQHTL